MATLEEKLEMTVRADVGTSTRKAVLFAIACLTDGVGRNPLPVEDIAKHANCSRRAAQNAIGWLAGIGAVLIDHSTEGRSHAYRVDYRRISGLKSPDRKTLAPRRHTRLDARDAIFKRDGFKCVQCGSETDLRLDHIIPVSKGGGNSLDNLQTLCNSCNCRKGATVGR